jgi:outer membrane lipopolysaccharide assembly protein LptE/RlpB
MTLLRWVVALSWILLAGCGFQLRGTSLAQSDLSIAVVSEVTSKSASYNDFLRVVEATLVRSGAKDQSSADITLKISGFAFDTVNGAVDADVRVAERIATVTVEVVALDRVGEPLAEPWIMEASRGFRTDRTQLLGSYERESAVEQALYQSLANRILRSLQVLGRGLAAPDQAAVRHSGTALDGVPSASPRTPPHSKDHAPKRNLSNVNDGGALGLVSADAG